MTYYNPLLALWLKGDTGQQAAEVSDQLNFQANAQLAQAYASAGFKVADVASAFSSSDFSTPSQLPNVGTVPLNRPDLSAA
ncbi:hypothetical protein [Kitasatospora sp. NPDC059571]|uniref:hypothetical protein n=1 Tax=Kitasatospora sp. NPDC059571 TaxID=3346871 RepID=UPI0036A7EBC0